MDIPVPGQSECFTPMRFATGNQPSRDLRLLNERQAILPLEPIAGADVHADLTQWPLRGLGVLSASLQGVRHGPLGRSGPCDQLYFGITVSGRSIVEQGGGTLALQDGDAVLLAPSDRFVMMHRGRVQFLGLRLPRAAVESHAGNVDRAMMRVIHRDTPALAPLTRYMRLVLESTHSSITELRPAVVRHVHELAASAIGFSQASAASAAGVGVRAARLRVIKAYVATRLTDPRLNVADVAGRHHITCRYVHKLFEYDGTTFSEFLLRLRLDRAHRALGDPAHAGFTISTIAFNAGFTDLSYFNRTFKRRFNATPSQVRRGDA